jgi:SAM-dependent methyltransferase
MKRARRFILPVVASLLFTPVITNAQQYEPSVGQEGKDVIWVPTPEDLVQAMLDLAKVTASDFVMDLGSGDGRIVIAAAKRGARAVGVEYNPDMVELSRRNAEKAGVSDKATFVNADLFETDLSRATVITMYLLPSLNLRLRPAILGLKPGTRIVSHSFTMGDWSPDKTVEKEGRTAYLWIVPARVDGVWTWRDGPGTAELKLTESYQNIQGTLRVNGKDLTLKNAKLEGDHISFSAGEEEYAGRVNGKSIEGDVKAGGRDQKWFASLRSASKP